MNEVRSRFTVSHGENENWVDRHLPLSAELLLISDRLHRATSLDGGKLDIAACQEIAATLRKLAFAITYTRSKDRWLIDAPVAAFDRVPSCSRPSRQLFNLISVQMVAQLRAILPMPRGAAKLLLLLCLKPEEHQDRKVMEAVLGLAAPSVKVMASHCRKALKQAGHEVDIRNHRKGAYSISVTHARVVWQMIGIEPLFDALMRSD